jgi:hypothetical protein
MRFSLRKVTDMEEVTAARAATMTGLSERTIRRKILAGEIRARRVAPNRYAINVHDLPARHASADALSRVDELEQRVRLLELRLQRVEILLAPSPMYMPPPDPADTAAISSPAALVSATRQPMLGELLAQLSHEVERLTPLLAPLLEHPPAPAVEGPRMHPAPADADELRASASG